MRETSVRVTDSCFCFPILLPHFTTRGGATGASVIILLYWSQAFYSCYQHIGFGEILTRLWLGGKCILRTMVPVREAKWEHNPTCLEWATEDTLGPLARPTKVAYKDFTHKGAFPFVRARLTAAPSYWCRACRTLEHVRMMNQEHVRNVESGVILLPYSHAAFLKFQVAMAENLGHVCSFSPFWLQLLFLSSSSVPHKLPLKSRTYQV